MYPILIIPSASADVSADVSADMSADMSEGDFKLL